MRLRVGVAEGVFRIKLWKIRTNFMQGIIEWETCYRATLENHLVSSIIIYPKFRSDVRTTADETA